MPHKTSLRCTICQSPYRVEIETLRAREHKTFDEIIPIIIDKYGVKIAKSTMSRHFLRHFNLAPEQSAVVEASQRASKLLFKEEIVSTESRVVKLSAMMNASYEYLTNHYDDLDIKTALQMMLGSMDQLNKMQALGVMAKGNFLMQFLEQVSKMKDKEEPIQIQAFEADELGQANLVDNTVDNLNKSLS